MIVGIRYIFLSFVHLNMELPYDPLYIYVQIVHQVSIISPTNLGKFARIIDNEQQYITSSCKSFFSFTLDSIIF